MTLFDMNRLMALALVISNSAILMAQTTPCVDGMAGDYPCQNVSLLGHLSVSDLLAEQDGGVYLNDIWGWTDSETGKEYAIVGMANGTSFVDITDPTDPIMLGILPEHHAAESTDANSSRVNQRGGNSVWRDVKVYSNHAYIVSEDASHGMQVFDLTELRELGTPEEPVTFTEAGHYDGVGDAHNVVINEETGFAYVVGATGATTCGSGGLHIVNIQDPKNPIYEACFDNDGYTHDAQCVIYNGPDADYSGKEICFNSNEETVTIVDVDDKDAITMISSIGYEGVEYTHQGWLTEDHKYFISNDELDENRGVTNTTKTFIWDVQDLDNPELIQVYDHTTSSIDHNLYIVDDIMYQSNYASGLRVFDISEVEKGFIRETGYFDTYPEGEGASIWSGSWSNYPFFESGTIAVSDQTNGLFLVKVDYSSSYVVHQPENFEGCEEEEIYVWFEVAGDGLTYQWQYDLGSGFVDIEDTENYSNINSNILIIKDGQVEHDGISFRCVASDSDNEYASESAMLTLNVKPTPDFDYDLFNNRVVFSNLTVNGDSYEWDFGDGSSKTIIESPTHEYSTSGNYTVILAATNDCGTREIESDIALIITAVDSFENDIVVYPNPGESFIQLKGGRKGEQLSYSIFNASGQKVLHGLVISGQQQSINAGSLYAGLYFLEIEDSKGNRIREKLLMK